jgi:hypothetical protein
VQRYYAYDPSPADAEYTKVRVSVMDSTGAVLSAGATANRMLLLPWYVNRGTQGSLDLATISGDGVLTCKDDNFLYVYLRLRGVPANVRFGTDLPIDARWRLTGWDAFLRQIPPASARLRSFGPVAAVLGVPGYDVDVQLPPMTQREGARVGLEVCGGADLLGSTKPDGTLSISWGNGSGQTTPAVAGRGG